MASLHHDAMATALGPHKGPVLVPRLPPCFSARDVQSGRLGSGHIYHTLTVDGSVEPQRTRLVRSDLEALVLQAGGAGNLRPDWNQMVALQHLFASCLEKAARVSSDPKLVKSAAQALATDSELFLLFSVPEISGAHGRAAASFDATAWRHQMAAMAPGQHGYVRVTLVNGTACHAMAIALRKEPDGRSVRLGIVNPEGWPQALKAHGSALSKERVMPAVWKTVDVDSAAAAMRSLLAGWMPHCPETQGQPVQAAAGHPLYAWLAAVHPARTAPLPYCHGTGRPLQMRGQKGDDCALERVFAFMAAILPPVDYKLAKATCMNGLLQIADALEASGPVGDDPLWQAARRRLQQRITNSLGRVMLATSTATAHLEE